MLKRMYLPIVRVVKNPQIWLIVLFIFFVLMVARCMHNKLTFQAGIVVLCVLLIIWVQRKIHKDRIEYLNYHDILTGVYNRKYIEIQKELLNNREILPLSIIFGDIDGLKLINDAFGHAKGDRLICETARILQSFCRKEDVLARTGSGEFCILLPDTDKIAAISIIESIKSVSEENNRQNAKEGYFISISLGYSTKESNSQDLDQVIKQAQDNMYKAKLLEQKSSHSAIISSIKATLFEKSQDTEEHAERLAELARRVGVALGLTPAELDDLELLATLHDIGKVGINEKILFKPGKLSAEEWAEMKMHPEIGYRIAASSPELAAIAEYILSHHERWDGGGYPRGLKGVETPLPARILAVVDAFDAMTSDRVYRKALTLDEAVNELQKHAGSQFDPVIVETFIKILD